MKVQRVFHHWFSERAVGFYLAEQCAMGAAFVAAMAILSQFGGPLARHALEIGTLSFFLCLSMQVPLYFADLYNLKVAAEDRVRGTRWLCALGIAAVIFSGLILFLPGHQPYGVMIGFVGATVASMAARRALPRIIGPPERVLIVGKGPRALELARTMEKETSVDFKVAGLLTGGEARTTLEQALWGKMDRVAARLGASIVVVAPENENTIPEMELMRCRVAGLRVLNATAFAERIFRRLPVRYLKLSEIIFTDGFRFGWVDRLGNRLVDFAASLLLAAIAAPVAVLVMLAIRIDSPGPIFYRQERVGKDGGIFWITKFRTMRMDAEQNGQPVWAKVGDERVTRVGRILRKTRLDELPQVISVLRGDMSFVGPRPERPYFVEQIKKEIPLFWLREAVKPGITGWAQLRYPYGASIDDARAKLEYDLYYIKNRSLLLDICIIFHTARHVLMARGAR